MKLKKFISVIMALSAFALCLPQAIMAESKVTTKPISDYYDNYTDQDVMLFMKNENVVVDGKGDEWDEYPSIKPQNCTVPAKMDITVEAKVGWDDERFYLFTEVYDDNFFPATGGNYWQGDCIQIILGPPERIKSLENGLYEYGLSYDTERNEPYLQIPGQIAATEAKRVETAVVRQGNYTRYEMSIPWDMQFEGRPETFTFCLVAADNNGTARDNVVYMEKGIHDSKYNDYYPTMVFVDSADGDAFPLVMLLNGEFELNTGDTCEYSLDITNFGDARTEKISIEGLGYEAELNIPAQCMMSVPIPYTAGDEKKKDILCEVVCESNIITALNTLNIHPTLDVYQDRIDAIKERLEEVNYLITKCQEMGIFTDYEEINANVVRVFLDYVVEDVNNKDTDRMEYTLTEMEKLNEQAYESLKSYILGSKLPYDVPRYVSSGALEVKDGVFYGWTENNAGKREYRPVYLIGMGHGNYARKDIPNIASVGGNYMQIELEPSLIVKPAGPIPEWRGGKEDTVIEDEKGNHMAHFVDTTIKQNVPVIPEKKYRLTFDAYGTPNGGCWISFDDYSNTKPFTPTKDKKQFSFEMTAYKSAVKFFVMNIRGEVYIDNIKMVQIDENGQELGENQILNGDFEKVEHDSRFILEFSGTGGLFNDFIKAAENNMLISVGLRPHGMPSWIRETYPEIVKRGIKMTDGHTDVMKDFNYTYGKGVARLLKNFPAINDICVHNEERLPIYMDNGYLPYLHEWLKKHYNNDINALNENYGSDYTSFDEVPMPHGLERTSRTWDLAMCSNELAVIERQSVYNGVKEAWPEAIVHGKLQSDLVFSSSFNRFTQAIDPVGSGRLFGVHGMDGGAQYKSGMFVDNAFYPGSAVGMFKCYDHVTSDLLAPILNTEDHIDGDNDLTVTTDIGDHCARYMWEACLHGRCASVSWSWIRGGEKMHIGHMNYRPDQVAKITRTALDVHRLSKEIAALSTAERTVQIVHSMPSYNRDYVSNDALSKVYESCVYSGLRPYILTDPIYDKLFDTDVLIIPAARYASERLLRDLLDFVNAGKELVLVGDFCLELNEYGKKHDENLLKQIYEKATVIPVEYEIDETYNEKYQSVNSEAHITDSSKILMEAPELKVHLESVFKKHNLMTFDIVDTETGETVKENVKWMYTEYEGKMLLNVAVYSEYGVTKRYKVLYNGKEIPSMRELRSGRLITDSIVELDASTPQLLQFDLQ